MEAVYWDTRSLDPANLTADVVWDVKVLYDWRSSLADLVRKVQPPGMGTFLDLDRRVSAYITAASEGQVHGDIPTRELIPTQLFKDYSTAREIMAAVLLDMKDGVSKKHYAKHVYPLLRDVRVIEKNGIHIDEPLLRSSLKRNDLVVHERAFLRGVSDLLQPDGRVYSKITPVGTRTGRMGVEDGFPCMTIPHGLCRQLLTSRFNGGTIVTIDFNAIDYRCLVDSLGNSSLQEFYRGERDFHAKTASYIEAERDVTKKVTYTHLYGGSKKTLQKQTLLPESEIDRMLGRLDLLFQSISAKRTEMAIKARECGYVFTPSGVPVEVTKDDHDGKVVGLYAQSYSSEIFNRAVAMAVRMFNVSDTSSRVIFTVHDEIVIDHNGLDWKVKDLAKAIEQATGFVVKLRRGVNYGEATD